MANTELSSVFEAPSSKGFQFNGHADGSVGQDVNQFQGSVAFSVPLVSLAGRSGLNLEVTAVYNSTVLDSVRESNRVAPTGIVGLGWDLLIDRIEASYSTVGNRDSAVFYLVKRGARNRLYRSTRTWQRAQLAASYATTLDQSTLSTGLLSSLLQQSLVVDPSSVVAVLAAGSSWEITDSVNEFVLKVVLDPQSPTVLAVVDGGAGYETEAFDFARVSYYEQFEKWDAIATSGLGVFFGGGVQSDSQGNHTSRGNSIEWGVKWNNWAGPSNAAANSRLSRILCF